MKARELLSDESKWATGHAARDSTGMPCDFSSPTACCFCLYGAIRKCYGATYMEQVEKVKQKLNLALYTKSFHLYSSTSF